MLKKVRYVYIEYQHIKTITSKGDLNSQTYNNSPYDLIALADIEMDMILAFKIK